MPHKRSHEKFGQSKLGGELNTGLSPELAAIGHMSKKDYKRFERHGGGKHGSKFGLSWVDPKYLKHGGKHHHGHHGSDSDNEKIPLLTHAQRVALHEYMKPVEPEKIEMSAEWQQGNQELQNLARGGVPSSPVEGSAVSFLQNLLNRNPEEHYRDFATPFMRQFREQTVPQLSEQFAGLNALGSSGFQNSLGQAGAGLSENLASLKASLIDQLLSQQVQGSNVGLGYAQLPAARQAQHANLISQSMQNSMMPQSLQQEANRYAEGLTNQRQNIAIGTPRFNTVIPAEYREVEGGEGGGGGSFGSRLGGAVAAGAGTAIGSAVGNMILPGIGGIIGGIFGGGVGSAAAG